VIFFFSDRSDFGPATVIHFVEEVLKITDNVRVAVEKKYIYIYLTIHLFPVNHNTPLQIFLVQTAILSLSLTFNSFNETSLWPRVMKR